MIKKIIRLINTLRHLRLKQMAFFVIRRKLQPKFQYRDVGSCALNPSFSFKTQGLTVAGTGSDGRFKFLNIELENPVESMDWSPSSVNRLWRYNLHYFDYLQDLARAEAEKTALIDHWITNNPVGIEPAWEPYTASLRIVNWIKFFSELDDVKPEWRQSLLLQASWLEKNLELHILANHFFENIKALAFAGLYFEGEVAGRWRDLAGSYLSSELTEQALADGGHYERSPQYHGIMLENYLDLINLIQSNPGSVLDQLLSKLQSVSISGLNLLERICFSGDRIPLLNDSALAASPSIDDLKGYAQALGLDVTAGAGDAKVVAYPDSGFYGYHHKGDGIILDCGDIGPNYQPGHTHCDFLSYELMLDTQPIVVDSGVYEYSPGEMRHYVRSTGAHNTVSVDGDEQSEIWGEFRVARRAKKLSAAIRKDPDGVVFEGAYSGFYGVKGKTIHQRKACIRLNNQRAIDCIEIADTVTLRGCHSVESFIHLHPDLLVIDRQDGKLLLELVGRVVAELLIDPGFAYKIEDSWYCPEFGKKIKNQRVTISHSGASPLVISYQIRKL